MMKHIQMVHGIDTRDSTESSCMCEVCGKVLQHSNKLKTHLLTHQELEKETCMYCLQVLKKDSFKSHKTKCPKFKHDQLGKVEVPGDLASKKSVYQTLISFEQEHESGKSFKCNLCPSRFKKRKFLVNHIRCCHTFSNQKKLVCGVCDKGFVREMAYKIHMRSHTGVKPYKCRICQKSFRQLGHVREHLRSHGGVLFQCYYCHLKFKTRQHLGNHARVHCNVQPYICMVSQCAKTFRTIDFMLQHFELCARKSPENSIHCNICNRSFMNVNEASNHAKVHMTDDAKVYPCENCSERFSSFKRLYLHMTDKKHFVATVSGNGTVDKMSMDICTENTDDIIGISRNFTIEQIKWDGDLDNLLNQYDYIQEEGTVEHANGEHAATELENEIPEATEAIAKQFDHVGEETNMDDIDPHHSENLLLLATHLSNIDEAMNNGNETNQIVEAVNSEFVNSGVQSVVDAAAVESKVILEVSDANGVDHYVLVGSELDVGTVDVAYNNIDEQNNSIALETGNTITTRNTNYEGQQIIIDTDGKPVNIVPYKMDNSNEVIVTVDIENDGSMLEDREKVRGDDYQLDFLKDNGSDINAQETNEKENLHSYSLMQHSATGTNESLIQTSYIKTLDNTEEIRAQTSIQSSIYDINTEDVNNEVTTLEENIVNDTGQTEDVSGILREAGKPENPGEHVPNLMYIDGKGSDKNVKSQLLDASGNEILLVNEKGEYINWSDLNLSDIKELDNLKFDCDVTVLHVDEAGVSVENSMTAEKNKFNVPMEETGSCEKMEEFQIANEALGLEKEKRTQNIDEILAVSAVDGEIIDSNVKGHIEVGKEKLGYKCNFCAKVFPKLKHLNFHKKTHLRSSDRKYKCLECGQGFNTPCQLKIHERKHSGDRPYICKECGNSFKQSGHLKTHLQMHMGDLRFTCKHCDKKFITNSQLKVHLKKFHTSEISAGLTTGNTSKWTCKQCGKAFLEESDLTKHQVEHLPYETQFELLNGFTESNLTPDQLKTPRKLKDVKQVNIKEGKSQVCDICGEWFSKNSLASHIARHKAKEGKLYSCKLCPWKFFKNPQGLEDHMECAHKDWIQCEKCGIKVSNRIKLKKHIKSAHSERKMKCTKCYKEFVSKAGFVNHCRICFGEAFKSKLHEVTV